MWKRKMENKHGKSHSGSAFLWGFILGAIFASLLTTKKGRAILRELINTGMELIEDFIEDRKNKSYEKATEEREKVIIATEKEEVAQAAEDLATGIEPVEGEVPSSDTVETSPKPSEIEIEEVSDEAFKFAKKLDDTSEKPKKMGSKRRLFKGIRKGKPN